MLVYWVIESASIATDQFFGHLADPAQPVTMSPVFAVLALISLVPTIILVRGLGQRPTAE